MCGLLFDFCYRKQAILRVSAPLFSSSLRRIELMNFLVNLLEVQNYQICKIKQSVTSLWLMACFKSSQFFFLLLCFTVLMVLERAMSILPIVFFIKFVFKFNLGKKKKARFIFEPTIMRNYGWNRVLKPIAFSQFKIVFLILCLQFMLKKCKQIKWREFQ